MVEKTKEHIETVNYTYEQFLDTIELLASRLFGKKYDGIYAIPRGGMMIGLWLSHRLKLPILEKSEITNDTLIVDDICDTGNTMKKYPKNQKVVLVTKVSGAINIKNMIYDSVYKDNQWVRFFWEVE